MTSSTPRGSRGQYCRRHLCTWRGEQNSQRTFLYAAYLRKWNRGSPSPKVPPLLVVPDPHAIVRYMERMNYMWCWKPIPHDWCVIHFDRDNPFLTHTINRAYYVLSAPNLSFHCCLMIGINPFHPFFSNCQLYFILSNPSNQFNARNKKREKGRVGNSRHPHPFPTSGKRQFISFLAIQFSFRHYV